MIEYILIIYLIMIFWSLKWLVLDDEGFKVCFKLVLIAPLSLPCNIIRKFAEW